MTLNIAEELGDLIERGSMTVETLSAATGISTDRLKQYLEAASQHPDAFTPEPSLSPSERQSLSVLSAKLCTGLSIDDDERLQGLLETLIAEFKMDTSSVASLTGVSREDVERILASPNEVHESAKYRAGLRFLYLNHALGSAGTNGD